MDLKTALETKNPTSRAILELIFSHERGERPVLGNLKDLTLYHGTPEAEIDSMLTEGIMPQDHGLLGGNWFCVSPNSNVLQYFGEGDTNGFAAEPVSLERCLFLTDRLLNILFFVATGEGGKSKREQAEAWFEPRNIDYAQVDSDDFGKAWRHITPYLDAVVWPDCYNNLVGSQWFGAYNTEAEISLTQNGCRAFQKNVVSIIRRGRWNDKPDELQTEFPAISRYLQTI